MDTQWISIIAVLLSPLIAVQVTKFLEKQKEEKNRKLEIFRILMGQRGLNPRTDEYITALNQVDVVFHNDTKVRSAYSELYKVTSQNHPELADSGKYLIMLLQEMAKVLNYGNIRDLDIDKYYSTQQRADDLKFQREYYSEFYRVLKNSENFGEKRKEEE